MTAPPRPLPDAAALDGHIVDALAALRLARAVSNRSPNARALRAQDDAESRLNGRLEDRQATLRR
jgi:hypothetical protein